MAIAAVTWANAKLLSVSLVLGTENYLAGRAIKNLKDQARQKYPNLEVIEPIDNEYSPGLLLNLATPSLFAEPKFITISALGDGLIEDIEEFLANPPEDTFVVIRISSLVGIGGKLKSKFSGLVQVIQCDELKRESDRVEFIKSEFARAGQKISPDAIRALSLAFNEDMAELGGACAQLMALGRENISAEIVNQIFEGRVETNAFRIVDAALSGQASESIRLLRHGLATGIDQVALTAALAMRIRQLARLFNDRNAAPAALGMQPWQLDKARKDLSGWEESGLISVVNQLAQTDADVKGASKDPAFSLESLLLTLANKGK